MQIAIVLISKLKITIIAKLTNNFLYPNKNLKIISLII